MHIQRGCRVKHYGGLQSYLILFNLLFLPCKELRLCVRQHLVTWAKSRAELLSEQRNILRERFHTILKQHEDCFRFRRSNKNQPWKSTNLWVVLMGGFILVQQLHQSFVLIHLGQTDSATHSWWIKVKISVECFFFFEGKLPVVEKCLRVFEDVSGATSNCYRCFVHRYLKLWVEEVSHHTVGNEWPFQLWHKNKTLYVLIQINTFKWDHALQKSWKAKDHVYNPSKVWQLLKLLKGKTLIEQLLVMFNYSGL